MDYANYSMSYMFFYSERPGTLAARKLTDDIPLETKKRRLQEVVEKQQTLSLQHNLKEIGKVYEILIEGDSKKSELDFKGRNSQNKMTVFPKMEPYKKGDYVKVKILEASSATLKGEIVQ